jgi:integrase
MSIRKRAWRNDDGTKGIAYVVDYRDLDGHRRNKQFATREAAETWDAQTHIDIKAGVHIPDTASVTVAHAGALWLASCEGELVRSSYERNRQHVDLHIAALIGDVRLNQLSVPKVRSFADRMRATGRSAALTRAVLVSLGTLLADAAERGLTTTNAVREMKRQRKKRRGPTAEKPKAPLAIGVDIPHPKELAAILKAASGRPRRLAMFSLLAFSGLRGSELRGLRWVDLNLTAGKVTVCQRADAWKEIGGPKSAAGYRTIPLPPGVVHALKEWKLACPGRDTGKTDAAGEPIKVLDLVFPTEAGGVAEHQKIVTRSWHPLQVRAGVVVPLVEPDGSPVVKPVLGPGGRPVIGNDGTPVMREVMVAKYSGLHSLRHYFCSWCAAPRSAGGLGLTLKETQVRMGHSTLAMTADTYGHLWPTADDPEALAAAERAILQM